jgi:DNA-binding response OmpR family regulator
VEKEVYTHHTVECKLIYLYFGNKLNKYTFSDEREVLPEHYRNRIGAESDSDMPEIREITKEGSDILVIEDDRALADTIRRGWPVPADRLKAVYSYRQSLHIIQSAEIGSFDGIILDIHLPDGDGLTILRAIREKTDVPVILISGTGTDNSRADAMDIGADGYIMKPFQIRELQARIARLIKVRNDKDNRAKRKIFELSNGIICNLELRNLTLGNKEIVLTDAEVRILGYLFDNSSRVCSKTALYKYAFFRSYESEDKTLEVYISRLRKKIGELDAAAATKIQTVRGSGYRLSVN